MVSSHSLEGLVYNIKLSSVGPGSATSPGTAYDPNGMDLAMKLHYLRGIYYFESPAFEGVDSQGLKGPVFHWLNQFPVPCGRARRDELGRFFIKCNDCGVRFLEAQCRKTLDEWMEIKDANLEKILVPNQSVGPEPEFSPLVLLQFTRFKCGGMAVGLSWAHILGDAFSSAEFMDSLGRHTSSEYRPGRPIIEANTNKQSSNFSGSSLAIKRVDPVGDKWAYVTDCKMEPFSFEITPAKLIELQSRLNLQRGTVFTPFELISAVVWKCIAKIRDNEVEPNVVTILKKGEQNEKFGVLSNNQVVNVVKIDFPIIGAELSDLLAALVKKDALDERIRVDEAMEKENGLPDVIIYGANLTFVNFDEAKFYDFKWKEYNPVNVSYRIDGVGEQGAVLVLPGRNAGSKNGGGRTVMTILPKDEIIALKSELVNEELIMA